MPNFPTPPHNNRIGFHYYPDYYHYRETDLRSWLPELESLGATWVTLLAPAQRAIPENFIRGLISQGIEPILHFQLPLETPSEISDLDLLFSNYAKWGVHYAVLFNSPNDRSEWSPAAWTQLDLVERFLDRFVPAAEAAAKAGLVPVFPPLKPGGDYWDTAFLRASLNALQRRGNHFLLDRMILSANAYAGDLPLTWGSGGPEQWPEARPYQFKGAGQDQIGFCIYDWYIAITQAVIGEPRPVILLKLGSSTKNAKTASLNQKSNVRRTLSMAQVLAGPTSANKKELPGETHSSAIKMPPPEVLCGNFWLLTTELNNPYADQAWYLSGDEVSPKVHAIKRWVSNIRSMPSPMIPKGDIDNFEHHPIPHYLILPAYEWGITDWHLNAARPFIRKYRPMIGFSLNYAVLAERVTVVGDTDQFPEKALEDLRSAGCRVERIRGDGTSIATQLAEK